MSRCIESMVNSIYEQIASYVYASKDKDPGPQTPGNPDTHYCTKCRKHGHVPSVKNDSHKPYGIMQRGKSVISTHMLRIKFMTISC